MEEIPHTEEEITIAKGWKMHLIMTLGQWEMYEFSGDVHSLDWHTYQSSVTVIVDDGLLYYQTPTNDVKRIDKSNPLFIRAGTTFRLTPAPFASGLKVFSPPISIPQD